MGEGVSKKPNSFGLYVAFYGILLYYVAFSSALTIHFIYPFTFRLLKIVWLIFIDKRWNVLAFLLCLAAVVRHIFRRNKHSTKGVELVDLPLDFELSSYPPFLPPHSSSFSSPPSPLPSPPSSPSSTFSSPRSPPSSSSWSSSCSLSPPPPPPFKMRSWKYDYYAKIASNVSLNSEDSGSSEDLGDKDIDAKAEKFIAEFRRRLYFENQQYADDAS